MVKIWMFLLVILSGLAAYSQELMLPALPEPDSLDAGPDRSILYHQLLNGTFMSDELFPLAVPDFNPEMQFSERWLPDVSGISFMPERQVMFLHGYTGMPASLFYHDGIVLNSALYKLNDRFTLGGYSLGGRPAFTAPLPNRGLNNFDYRSSTIFLQYNISRNIKVETRFNVNRGPATGF